MEIDKIFNGGVDSIADNIFGTVNNSVSEVREMQKKKVAENVQLVIQALKKIESDLREQFGSVSGSLEKRILSIKDGKDGINGRDGKPGRDGKDGKDGKDGRPGRDGLPGRPGADGSDGVGVLGARIDFDGALVITLTNGQEINVGEVVAPDLAESIKVITNGGGTSQSVLDTLASLQAQISAIASLGAVSYQGTWNASTNTPTITSGSGTKGYYYVVSVAGTTSIDSEAKWGVGDWIVFNGTSWQKVDGGDTGDFTNLNVSGTTTLSGGTANGVAYLNGSKVLTTGSALTFDGTNLNLLGSTTSPVQINLRNDNAGTAAGTKLLFGNYAGTETAYLSDQFDGSTFNVKIWKPTAGYMAFGISNAEQMRLTSTGLGIGTSSPSGKLSVTTSTMTNQIIADSMSDSTTYGLISLNATRLSTGYLGIAGGGGTDKTLFLNVPTGGKYSFRNNFSEQMVLDSSGNLGLGVTPSAWVSSVKAFDVGSAAASYYSGGVTHNAYFDATDSRWEYKGTGPATFYNVQGGTHAWSIAASGTAGSAISFTQAMTLDASGNLLVGKTSASATVVGTWVDAYGYISCAKSTSTNSDNSFVLYSTGAAAYRFYVGMGGTISATSTTITAISDQRLKENIRDLDDGLSTVMALKPRKFDWKTGKGKDIKNDRGFIAQEFEQVLPDMVENWRDPAPEGEGPYKAVNPNLIPTLVKAIQEQQALIEQLTARVAQLEGK